MSLEKQNRRNRNYGEPQRAIAITGKDLKQMVRLYAGEDKVFLLTASSEHHKEGKERHDKSLVDSHNKK